MERKDMNRTQNMSNEIKSNKTSKGMYRHEKSVNETKEAKLPQKKSTAKEHPEKSKEMKGAQMQSKKIKGN
jgi:hypothetical protein